MSRVKNEIEDDMLCNDQTRSRSNGEGNGGSVNGGVVLKKGPWTSAEDAILVDYVRKHGEGNWNAVQKHSGLSRCGKSCRLRWANHLRPNLKKGSFTADEEHLIAQLHSEMGNRWARMAAHVSTLCLFCCLTSLVFVFHFFVSFAFCLIYEYAIYQLP
jgi:transcription factor MYB, plant